MKYQWYNDEIKDSGKLYHLVVINNNDIEHLLSTTLTQYSVDCFVYMN